MREGKAIARERLSEVISALTYSRVTRVYRSNTQLWVLGKSLHQPRKITNFDIISMAQKVRVVIYRARHNPESTRYPPPSSSTATCAQRMPQRILAMHPDADAHQGTRRSTPHLAMCMWGQRAASTRPTRWRRSREARRRSDWRAPSIGTRPSRGRGPPRAQQRARPPARLHREYRAAAAAAVR